MRTWCTALETDILQAALTYALTAAPSDSCTRQVTLEDRSATGTGDAGGHRARKSEGGCSTVENLLINVFANRF